MNFQIDLIHGSHKYCGIDIPTHYHEQGSLLIQYPIYKLRKNNTEIKLIRISIKYLQLKYGSLTTVLGKITRFPKYITKTWITNAW